jgi:hypothetical protein
VAAKQKGRTDVAEFNVSGEWRLFQNNGWIVDFDLNQNGTLLSGDADTKPAAGGTSIDGDIESGSVSGNLFTLTIKWKNGPKGQYNGTFGADGRLSGQTFDLANPLSQALWVSGKTFRQT